MHSQSPWDAPKNPISVSTPHDGPPRGSRNDKLPGFCMTIAIIDLIMASIRLLLVPLSVLGYSMMQEDDPLIITVPFEIGFGLLIGLAGIIAAIGMLMKKEWAIPAGWANVCITVPGIFVGVWQASIATNTDPMLANNEAAQIGAMIGAVIAVGIRLTLVVLVVVALLKYKAWLARR